MFVLKMLSAFTSAAYIFKNSFTLGSNTMNPDQTALNPIYSDRLSLILLIQYVQNSSFCILSGCQSKIFFKMMYFCLGILFLS